MLVFVSEYLVGGGIPASDCHQTMRREGLAMLTAVVADIAKIPNCQVVTTLHQSVLANLEGTVIRVEDPAQESSEFEQLLHAADAVLVIAPETDGVLESRCRRVVGAMVTSWNCTPAAIELCGDKLRLCDHLMSHGVKTIPTALADWNYGFVLDSGPVVLKPRDGAGSSLTFLVQNLDDWQAAAGLFRQSGKSDRAICQPYVAGRPLSVGMNFSLDGQCRGCLPVGEQILSDDGHFRYSGGIIPARISPQYAARAQELALAACQTIPGIAGYVGVDLLLTDLGEILIVEINPRLTSSYVGYRQLMSRPLPMLWAATDAQDAWAHPASPIEFSFH